MQAATPSIAHYDVPILTGLYVMETCCPPESTILLNEGEQVDIMAILDDGFTALIRVGDGRIGMCKKSSLATEQEICDYYTDMDAKSLMNEHASKVRDMPSLFMYIFSSLYIYIYIYIYIIYNINIYTNLNYCATKYVYNIGIYIDI